MKSVIYSRDALKVLARMPVPMARRIKGKVAAYAADPASQANKVTALQGRPSIRLRVGDWRVIVNERGQVLDVVQIGPRGGIYD